MRIWWLVKWDAWQSVTNLVYAGTSRLKYRMTNWKTSSHLPGKQNKYRHIPSNCLSTIYSQPSVLWHWCLGSRKDIWPLKKSECCYAGGDATKARCKWPADVLRVPVVATATSAIARCSKSRNGLTFWYPFTRACPRIRLLNECSNVVIHHKLN